MTLENAIQNAINAGFDQYVYSDGADDWTLDNLLDAISDDEDDNWTLDISGDLVQLNDEGRIITSPAYKRTDTLVSELD